MGLFAAPYRGIEVRMKKKIPMLLLLAAPYAMLGGAALAFTGGRAGFALLAWALAFLLVFLPNMVYAFILPRKGYTQRQLLFWNMLLKLCNIPFYCLVFLMGMMMSVFVIPLLPIFILVDYTVLLPSTMYGVSGLLQARKARRVSTKALVVNGIMQFMFCLDVCSAVYLYTSSHRANNE